MYILGIETTGEYGSAALLDREGVSVEESGNEAMNHLRDLAPMIDSLMKKKKAGWEDIGHIAVSTGPGSFTGIRIGVSTGRTLNQITGIPLMDIPTLQAFAVQEGRAYEDCEGLIFCPLLDARRERVYGGAYTAAGVSLLRGGTGGEGNRGKVFPLNDYLGRLEVELGDKDGFVFAGSGLKAYGGKIRLWAEEKGKKAVFKETFQRAEGVVQRAKLMLESPNSFAGFLNLNYESLKPHYMGIPEAERKLREAKKGTK